MVSFSPKFKQRLRKITTLVVVLVVAYFFARIVNQQWQNVKSHLISPSWMWLVIGIAGFSTHYLVRIRAWQILLKNLQHFISYRIAGRILMLSEIVRYIPGNIWSVLGRIMQSSKFGVPPAEGLLATVIEVYGMLVAALCSSAFIGIFTNNIWLGLRIILVISAIISFGLILFPNILFKVFNWILKKTHREQISKTLSTEKWFELVFLYVIAWFGYSIGGIALVRAFLVFPNSAIPTIFVAFPLSWFIGYISFITPSGLGVREGAFVVLTSQILTGGTSAIFSAISRFGVTLVELFWVIIFGWSTVWAGLKNNIYKLFLPRTIVVCACCLFAAYFGAITVVMQQKVITSRFDLGNMSQIVWNTSHGRIFQMTDPYGKEVVSRYAYHADIFLVLLAPFYWVYPHPETLLIIQAILVAFGGWFVFRLAKRILGHEWLAAVLALSYLFYPTLQRAVLFDFHPLTVASMFALGMVLYYLEKHWWKFAIFTVLFVLCKEELALMVFSFALLMLWKERPIWRRQIIIAGISLIYFITTFFVIMPAARRGNPSFYSGLYDTLGADRQTITTNVLHHPRLVLSMILGKQARGLYYGLLNPVSYVSLASPTWLAVAWPDFAVDLLNERPETRFLIYHYHAVISAFIYISAIFGTSIIIKRLNPLWERSIRKKIKISLSGIFISIFLASAGIESALIGPLPYSKQADKRVYWHAPMAPVVKAAVKDIPNSARISATNTIGAQLSERTDLYQFPIGIGEADYILILMATEKSLEWQRNHVQAEDLSKDSRYQLIQHTKNFYEYKKL
jgi:uncharacterized membrane protein